MGAGQGVGENRASEAVNNAIASPLLQDISIDGAKGVLVNISAREDSLTMAEVTEATTRIYDEVHDDANIILGVMFDESLGEAMRVTVVATGIETENDMDQLPSKVKTLVMKQPESTENSRQVQAQTLPFDAINEDEQAEGVGFSSKNQPSHRKNVIRSTFTQSKTIFDEDELDRPTFIRRNEN